MPKMFMSPPSKVKSMSAVVQECFCKIVGSPDTGSHDRNVRKYSPDEVDFILESINAMVHAYLKEPTLEQIEQRKQRNEDLIIKEADRISKQQMVRAVRNASRFEGLLQQNPSTNSEGLPSLLVSDQTMQLVEETLNELTVSSVEDLPEYDKMAQKGGL